MPRRTRSSLIEDIANAVALLPWWVGVSLALVLYFWLHHVAAQPVLTVATDLKHVSDHAARQLWAAIASILQYILPVACLIGSAVSAYKKRERNQLHLQVSRNPSRHELERISWQEFEKLVGEVFRRKGFSVDENGGRGPDGGVDLVLRLGNDHYFVQCKQWKVDRVGVATVRELYGVMAAQGAVGGFVVASGSFTDDAKQFADGRSIELVGTSQILRMIEETGVGADSLGIGKVNVPGCPSCGASMVRRTAKRGSRAGSSFWGCGNYPSCKGTRVI